MTDVLSPDAALAALRVAASDELRDDILPFWERNIFDADGWMVGEVGDDLRVRDDVPRHSVIVARILWAFSAAARAEVDGALRARWLAVGDKALRVLTGRCWDPVHGGVYWSLAPDGAPASDRKQVYAQAFAIYGLVEWHAATGDEDALDLAWKLFEVVEAHGRDATHNGYLEALARDWGALDDVRLSDRDLNAPKSMNTHLHVLEAYTSLVRATGDGRARASLTHVLRLCLDHIVADAPWAHCDLFFDREWNSQVETISFGHDIEASWLLWEAAEAVGDEALTARTRAAVLALADAVLAHGVDPDGSVLYEGTEHEVTEALKHWWPQAEGVLGWLNAYALTGDARFRDAALAAWGFIEAHVIDREHGEWFSVLSREGEPLPDHPASKKMGPWKCPYHNARACLEVMRRVGE